MYGYVSDSDSDDNDTENGYTVVTINGKAEYIPASSGPTVIDIPGMRNLQIGSGQVNVINGRTRTRHRESSPRGNSSSQKSHTPHSEKLTDSKEKPTRQDLNHVCNNIGKNWKKLARTFGLSKGQIEAIEVDFHIEGNYEMAYQTILKWKRQNGDLVTIHDLAVAIDSIGLTELARELPVR